MKKTTSAAYIAVILALILTFSLCSCNKNSHNLQSGSISTPTYLDDEEPSEIGSEVEEDSEQNTEDVTEQSPAPTEAPTDIPTEPITEAPTEPAPSLEYKSFGNGTCSVVGIGSLDDLYVVIPEKSPMGDVVTTIEEGAFEGNSSITVVQISSTVYSIGERAFADCKSLVHIAVDENNIHFSDVDGVLYDEAMTTLISYPAAKAAASLLLPETITSIKDMALYGCDSLKMIKFEGTIEQWAQISIGEKNYGIYTASLSFGE